MSLPWQRNTEPVLGVGEANTANAVELIDGQLLKDLYIHDDGRKEETTVPENYVSGETWSM